MTRDCTRPRDAGVVCVLENFGDRPTPVPTGAAAPRPEARSAQALELPAPGALWPLAAPCAPSVGPDPSAELGKKAGASTLEAALHVDATQRLNGMGVKK